MTTRILKYLAIFGLGSLAGYLVAKKLLEDKYAESAQEEIDSVKEYYEKKYAQYDAVNIYCENDVKITEELMKSAIEGFQEGLEEGLKEMEGRLPVTVKDAKSRIAYNDIAKSKMRQQLGITISDEVLSPLGGRLYTNEDDEVREEVRDAAGRTEREMQDADKAYQPEAQQHPYIISDVEYCEGAITHDKVSLYYYLLDDTLCEENEEIITDIANSIGDDAYALLRSGTVGTVWSRNERYGIDYEVCVVKSDYPTRDPEEREKFSAMSPREKYNQSQKITKNKKKKEDSDE